MTSYSDLLTEPTAQEFRSDITELDCPLVSLLFLHRVTFLCISDFQTSQDTLYGQPAVRF